MNVSMMKNPEVRISGFLHLNCLGDDGLFVGYVEKVICIASRSLYGTKILTSFLGVRLDGKNAKQDAENIEI